MFSRTIVGFDGTNEALTAVRLAQRLSAPDAVVIVADVLLPADVSVTGVVRGRRRVDAYFRASGAVSGEAPTVEFAAPRARSVAAGLHRLARETMAELIVIGSSRRRETGRILLGSNSEATLHGAPCAVAVSSAKLPEAMRRIGVAYDGTPSGVNAVRAAAAIARSFGADLTVLGVVDTRGIHPMFGVEGAYGDVRRRAEALTAEAAAGLRGVRRVHHRVYEGDPVLEALELGRDSSLLVVGSRAQGLALRLVLGSVSTKVVRRAVCPVLVLPADTRIPDRFEAPVTARPDQDGETPPTAASTSAPSVDRRGDDRAL